MSRLLACPPHDRQTELERPPGGGTIIRQFGSQSLQQRCCRAWWPFLPSLPPPPHRSHCLR